MKECKECKATDIPDDLHFCPDCGADLNFVEESEPIEARHITPISQLPSDNKQTEKQKRPKSKKVNKNNLLINHHINIHRKRSF